MTPTNDTLEKGLKVRAEQWAQLTRDFGPRFKLPDEEGDKTVEGKTRCTRLVERVDNLMQEKG